MRRFLLLIAIVMLAAGCGGNDEATPTDSGTTTTASETVALEVYWLRDGMVWPALRGMPQTVGVAATALGELLLGPTEQERADLGMKTGLPHGWQLADVGVENGVATVEFDGSGDFSTEALAQVVYTLTQFPTVESVEIQGQTLTRADFEDVTPAILVESPLPFEEVTSPLQVTGTANTFEAVFNYQLTDTDGRIIDEDFVMATSGTGERGTFEFTVPFKVNFDGVGELIVFELSAKDGSRINLVEIPLKMAKEG